MQLFGGEESKISLNFHNIQKNGQKIGSFNLKTYNNMNKITVTLNKEENNEVKDIIKKLIENHYDNQSINISEFLFNINNTQTAGATKYKKSQNKHTYKGREYCIWLGPRGGKYIKLKGEYTAISKL